jgi:hypothetical protein
VKGLISIDDVLRPCGLTRGHVPIEAAADVRRHICTPVGPAAGG